MQAQELRNGADKLNMDISAIAATGLDVAQSRFEKAATGVASSATEEPAVDTVSLSQQTIGLLSAKNEFSGAIRVVQVADEMQKTVLSMLG